MERIRVAVDAFDPITAAGLANHLRTSAKVTVVAESDLAGADVYLLCTDAVTAEVMSKLRRASAVPHIRSVLVTGSIGDGDVLPAVECRVVAVVPRAHATSDRLVRAVVGAHAGMSTMPSDLLGTLLDQVERLQRETLAPLGLTPSGLAPRELDVLRLVAEGLDTGEIARKLSYSERTVKNILYGVLNRLGLRNRSQAVASAIRAGVI
jgi:DNA-binding NarL/FixJ family response regulator